MDADTLMQQLLEDPSIVQTMAEPLPDDVAAVVIERLKAEADHHWWINANRSLELADQIIQIGQARNNIAEIALGTMARGDALKLLGRRPEAWAELEAAGQLFQAAGDQVGWARTRIGRVGICVDLDQVATALAEGERARSILVDYNVPEKLLWLDINTAAVHNYLGEHTQAIAIFEAALATAHTLGKQGEQWRVVLYTNIGFAYEALGDFRMALTFHERACLIAEARQESRSLAVAETNIAIAEMKQGHYRQALAMLHRAHNLYVTEQLPRDAAEVNRIIVECYLLLNRYAEARGLARDVAAAFRTFGEGYEEALTLLELAVAEAELGDLPAALAALDAAEPIFVSVGASTWQATTQLRRGQIALQCGDLTTAREAATASREHFQANGQQVNQATALLLYSRTLLSGNEWEAATEAAKAALQIAQQCNVPPLRYSTHLLLGHAAEAQHNIRRAVRHYRAAAGVVERVQRGLTITLRPGFLEDKGEALQALLALQLRLSQGRQAFETLERAKSQALMNYLTNREHLRWAQDDPRTRMLTEELNQLRAEHQWFYEVAHDQLRSDDGRAGAISQEQALQQVTVRERRMRAISEQLYLANGHDGGAKRTAVPTLADVQGSLADDTLLIEFYNDGQQLWAFAVDAQNLEVHALDTGVAAVDRLLDQLQLNVAAALKAGPESAATRSLANVAKRIAQRLYRALLEPLQHRIHNARRLVIVPYGSLHYLPFHLLHIVNQYIIDQHEVVVLPSAGLVMMQGPSRSAGARVLAHSWNGRLSHTNAEAQIVQQIWGGDTFYEQAASRSALRAAPTQILHIAAHGEHRLDNPDLSYIQLADGQLYTDDLLQLDLGYELVTLSACETGRANVVAGDELIGLGRGFLYAGAGALLASLWPVADATTVELMQHVYRALQAGASKAAALQHAQHVLRAAQPQLHPAFWGAFQLIGDARPLSTYGEQTAGKEQASGLQTATIAQ